MDRLQTSYAFIILLIFILLPTDTMTTVKQKHLKFVNEPMGDKSVTALPGVGPVAGRHLANAGITYAYQVVDQYIVVHRKNVDTFEDWLKSVGRMNDRDTRHCVEAVQEWTHSRQMDV